MPTELVLIAVLSGALTLLLLALLVLAMTPRNQGSTGAILSARTDPREALYGALTPEARQFLTAVVQADTSVVVIGPRRAGVVAFARGLASLVRGRKPVRTLNRWVEIASLVKHRPSCLVYLEAPGLISGIRKLRSLLAESRPSEGSVELWQAIEGAVDLFVVIRSDENGRARVETIAEPALLPSAGPSDSASLANVIFGWDDARQALVATGARPLVLERLRLSGILLPDHIFAPRL